MDDYFRDRLLKYDTTEGARTVEVTAGVQQGAVLGPEFCNIRYNDLLATNFMRETHLVGYADDIAGIVIADSTEDARRKISHLVRRISAWLDSHGLKLAASKTEMVVLTRQRWFDKPFAINIGEALVEARRSVRYLGLQLDEKLTFGEHIQRTADKANSAAAKLSRIMKNVGGPRYAKRRILMSTVNSIILYGAEI